MDNIGVRDMDPDGPGYDITQIRECWNFQLGNPGLPYISARSPKVYWFLYTTPVAFEDAIINIIRLPGKKEIWGSYSGVYLVFRYKHGQCKL